MRELPQIPKSYDSIYSTSERYQGHYSKCGYMDIWKKTIPMLPDVGSAKILDVGCGTGQFANFLFDNGVKNYVGYDFSTVAIDMAKKRCPQFQFVACDVTSAESYIHEYNTVVCIETLEHIEDDLGVVAKWKPGATVIASVPDMDDALHVRKFPTNESVVRRYGGLITFKEIVRIGCFSLFRGVRK